MRSTRFFMPLVAAALALGACDDGGVTDGSGRGRLTIMLTDAPGDMAEAFIKIEKIVLFRTEADATSNNATGRIEITPDVTDFIDLLNLTGGQLLELVDDEEVGEGSFAQMRVVLDEAYIVLNDGRVFATAGAELPAGVEADGTLKCPSCSASGYKVKFAAGGLNIVGNSTVVLDFDAAQSFGHEAGKSGQWIMHPVLKATATTVRFGTIKGSVALAQGVTLPACGGAATTLTQFVPLAILTPDTLTGTVDAQGAFRITSVFPGTYTLSYAKDLTFTNGDSLTFTAAPSVPTVNVAQADSATANYSISAASCH
jgi:hypothetical protein